MDGIQNLLGRTIFLEVAGKRFTLSAMTLRECAEREGIIVSMKADPRELLRHVPNSWTTRDREHASQVACQQADTLFRRASADDIDAFETSYVGMAWSLMRALRKHHPDQATPEGTTWIFRSAGKSGLGSIVRALWLSEERDLLNKVFMPGSRTEEATRIPWASLFRGLSDRYGWTWEQIGQMTMYSALVALGGKCPEDGRFSVDDEDYPAFQKFQERRQLLQGFY